MSLFVPTSKKETQALMRHLDKNRPAINERKQDPAYKAEIEQLREFHAKLYSSDFSHLPRPKAGEEVSPWALSGLQAECYRVAERFQVPFFDVVSDANSYANGYEVDSR
jgi:hypothetical protein